MELRVAKRTNEDFVPPKPAAFFGAGHRLGAPVPEISGAGASSSGSTMPGTFADRPSSSVSIRAESNTKFEVDQSKPMTSVQIRLADGTRFIMFCYSSLFLLIFHVIRIVCRMNLTHTVLDLRNFINA